MKPLNQLLDLTGKGAVVTGGAKGIGYGIAYRLAEAGAHVLLADLDNTALQSSVQKLRDKGWQADLVTADVSNENDVRHMITVAERQGPLDILVNNAGIFPSAPLAEMSETDFERVMRVNVRSVFLATKYAAEVMKRRSGGRIINITSIDALHPSMIGLAHYDASKHGVWGFTKNSALELAEHNIWVNAIAPGGITTPGVAAMNQDTPAKQKTAAIRTFMSRIPMRRMGEPDEIGTVALFLASDMANYMTGSQIVVDGGALLR